MERLKKILIQNDNHLPTEQRTLDDLYKKLNKEKFIYQENIELPYIMQYLEDFNADRNESFCYSKRSGRTGMSTGYLIDNLDPRMKNSAIAVMDGDDDILGVLVFNYVEWSNKHHDYDNSLYINSFAQTNKNLFRE